MIAGFPAFAGNQSSHNVGSDVFSTGTTIQIRHMKY